MSDSSLEIEIKDDSITPKDLYKEVWEGRNFWIDVYGIKHITTELLL